MKKQYRIKTINTRHKEWFVIIGFLITMIICYLISPEIICNDESYKCGLEGGLFLGTLTITIMWFTFNYFKSGEKYQVVEK